MTRSALLAGIAFAIVPAAPAAPLPQERVLQLCAQTDGPAHCGRLIEAEQLKALPALAVRDGDRLRISLFPSGSREFVDTTTTAGGKSFALWDYWSPVNAAILFTSDGERIGYAVLQRATGQLTILPAEPLLSPDRKRLAIADFCSAGCDNELSVWLVTREGIRKEAGFRPPEDWIDVTVAWKDGEILAVSYGVPGQDKPRVLERKLGAADWRRH